MDQEPAPRDYSNEAGIVRDYLPILTQLNDGRQCEVHGIVKRDEKGVPSRAWRLVLNPTSEKQDTGAIFDWDDTLDSYTERKQRFYEDSLSLVPEVSDETKEKFVSACKAINKASRVLPPNGVHPEHYSPLLELQGVNNLINSLQNNNQPEFIERLAEFTKEDQEEAARTFLQETVVPQLEGAIGTQAGMKDGKSKTYFVEKAEQATSVNFDKKPQGVDEAIWTRYKKHMTEVNIGEEDIENFDLPENARFFIATFGEGGFQLEKVIEGLKFLKAHGKRLPDEIVLFTRGRKHPVIKDLVNTFPGISKFVYVDDSLRQIESIGDINKIVSIRAQRAGSQRAGQQPTSSIKTIDMKTTKMSEILESAL
ncbi:MAG TPA: hypothetical protein VNA13_04785 [Xanthomonadales bacterium]|nr:hypothetical protein [Xanthomonadales bacterium]